MELLGFSVGSSNAHSWYTDSIVFHIPCIEPSSSLVEYFHGLFRLVCRTQYFSHFLSRVKVIFFTLFSLTAFPFILPIFPPLLFSFSFFLHPNIRGQHYAVFLGKWYGFIFAQFFWRLDLRFSYLKALVTETVTKNLNVWTFFHIFP